MSRGYSDASARWLFISAAAWLGAAVTLALLLAVKFVYPDFLSGHAWLQFGRLRPVHITLAAFGWLSMVQVAMAYYVVPRLARQELHSGRLAGLSVLLWNLFLLLAAATLLAGMTQGREYAELVYPLDLLFLLLLLLVAYNLVRTVLARREEKLYVSLWYFLAALLSMPVVYFVGNAMWAGGALYGVNDAIVNWFYGHN
ncbi:MAG: cytochrome-c oxidase, partial [Euryarchaeota archaeon]|nr:cytochrome-c oxidase [Euryarchaeota archaeon]